MLDYQDFLRQNRKRVNLALNKIVAACLLAGVGIFAGTALKLWDNITYGSAVTQMLLVIAISIIMYLANKKYAETYFPSVLGLISLDLVLGYSANVHIGIYLSYFIVPLIAIAFCDRIFFIIIAIMNYVAMFLSVLNISPYYGSMSLKYYTAADPGHSWFVSHMMGYTLEYICMVIAGWFICNHITKHMESLYDYQSRTRRQLRVMGSATDIFDQICYFNDLENTYVITHGRKFDYIEKNQLKASLKQLEETIVSSDMERFREFINPDTLDERLKNRNSIDDNFYSVEKGYFQAMFIAISDDENVKNNEFVFCTRDINEEKARERTLNEMARRDQPTSLLNRRAYEEDFAAYVDAQNHDLTLVVADIDGLKSTNDSFGHLAGDEMILTAARLLSKNFDDIGTVYRVGGDEFHILIRNEEIDTIEKRIASTKEGADNWKGKMGNTFSISIGLASAKENPNLDLKNMQKLADQRMYEDKDRYYASNPTADRR